MKVVIVGGVAGGASAAARLRRLDEKAEIVLVERGEYISFANCGLPYYVGGTITKKEALTLQTPQSFRARFTVDVRTGTEAVSIDRKGRTVTLRAADGREYAEGYDKLVLAPGAAPILPGIPGITSDRVFTLRTIPDTYRIKDFLDTAKPGRAVVAGAGAIGLEMAENLAHAGLKVTVAELADHAIASLDADAASVVHNCLADKGVTLLLKKGVSAIRDNGNGPLAVTVGGRDDANPDEIETDMVVMSVGVAPESALAVGCGLEVGPRGHIRVDRHMRTADPDIYAVGDAVLVPDWFTQEPKSFALAGPANRQGRIAADNIAGLDSSYDGAQGSAIIKIFDLTVASTGLTEQAAAKSGFACDAIHLYSPSHATYYPGATMISGKVVFEKGTGRILGGQFMGTDGVDKRCDVLATAIRANMTGMDLTRLELCYAPPYSSAKDPINMAGFVIENILTGKVVNGHWKDVPDLDRTTHCLLDVRTGGEHKTDHIPGALHIPLDDIRARLGELDRDKTCHVFCLGGLRSYIATRILTGNGFTCVNISGGWHWYETMRKAGFMHNLIWKE